MMSLVFSVLFVNNVSVDIPCALSLRDVPSVGLARPLARG
jgi:hypothetical protein